MIITKIEPQKRGEGRWSVFIDGRFAFGADGADILNYGLAENQEISRERLERVLRGAVLAKARDAALGYAACRARTEKEVRDKLAEDYPAWAAERAVRFLRNYGYIDDRVYARDFLEYKSNVRHNGLARIRYELRRRGVADDIIDGAVSELGLDEPGEARAALAALEERLRGAEFPEGRKERGRLYGYLARKGFSGGVIQEVFERMGAEGGGSESESEGERGETGE